MSFIQENKICPKRLTHGAFLLAALLLISIDASAGVRNWSLYAGVTSKQSSTYKVCDPVVYWACDYFPSSKAIDGNSRSYSRTYSGSQQWWTMDLGAVRTVDEIAITLTESGSCGPRYVSGADYDTGDKVTNDHTGYRCEVGSWCSLGGAYDPGSGYAWKYAWTRLGLCSVISGAYVFVSEVPFVSNNLSDIINQLRDTRVKYFYISNSDQRNVRIIMKDSHYGGAIKGRYVRIHNAGLNDIVLAEFKVLDRY